MTKKRRPLGRSAGLLGASQLIGSAFALVFPLLVVRRFNQTDFGVYKQIDLVGGLLLPIFGLGLDKSLVYFVPRDRERAPRYVTSAFLPCALVTLAALGAVALWPAAAAKIFGAVDDRLFLMVAVANGISSVFLLAGIRVLVAVGDTPAAGALTAVQGPILLLVAGGVLVAAPRLQALLWAYVAVYAGQILAPVLLLARRHLLAARADLDSFTKQLRYGLPLWGSAMLQVWANRIDRYLVSVFGGAAGYAIYAVGRTSIPFYNTMSSAVETVVAPSLAEWEGLGEHRRMAELWKATIARMLPIAIIVFAAIESIAGWMVPLLFTRTYRAAVPILRISAVSLLFVGYTGTDGVLRAFARVRFLFVTNLAGIAARLGLALFALKTGSFPLVAATAVGTESAIRAVQTATAARCLKMRAAEVVPVARLREPVLVALLGVGLSAGMTRLLTNGLVRLAGAALVWGSLVLFEAYRTRMLHGLGLWPPDPRRLLRRSRAGRD